MKNVLFILLLIAFSFYQCGTATTESSIVTEDNKGAKTTTVETKATDNIVKATLDAAINKEITLGEKGDIYKYYNMPWEDNEHWSNSMFGRCCTETDLQYLETLFFKVESTVSNPKYPIGNAADTKYTTAYVFNPNDKPRITLSVDLEKTYIESTKPKTTLKKEDVLVKQFKLSLINGYAKSADLFKKNGRVESFEVYLNDELKGSVLLLDDPKVQTFVMDFEVKKEDKITLIPTTYIEGEKYADDICITEIQTNLGSIGNPEINEKYNVWE